MIGNDVTVTMAAEAGQLQLNVFEPIIAALAVASITHLTAACHVLAERCVGDHRQPGRHPRVTSRTPSGWPPR